MRVLDANIPLRLILGDDPLQTSASEKFLKQSFASREPLWLSDLTFAEMVWVLDKKGIERKVVARLLRPFLGEPFIHVEHPNRLASALALYESHGVNFPDAYLAALAHEKGFESVVSFDRDFARLPVKWVEPK